MKLLAIENIQPSVKAYTNLGFVLTKTDDPNMVSFELPAGWSQAKHPVYSEKINIFDNQNRVRAIFDGNTITLLHRLHIKVVHQPHNAPDCQYSVNVFEVCPGLTANGEPNMRCIYTGGHSKKFFEVEHKDIEELAKKHPDVREHLKELSANHPAARSCISFFKQCFPDWLNPSAYWVKDCN